MNTGLAMSPLMPTALSAFSGATNRITAGGTGYDLAGNLTLDAIGQQFGYDAENRQTSYFDPTTSSTTTYAYDGEGRRVKKVAPDSTETVFVYDAFGNLAAEYSTAPLSGTGGAFYRTLDHLGSTRVVTDDTGAVVSRLDFAPFGEQIASTVGNRSSATGYGDAPAFRQKFTGQERDEESQNDYFLARYYAGPMGRFLSPDVPLADQWEKDPQSWNLYAYVRNNPLRHIDTTGRVCVVDPVTGTQHDDNSGGQTCAEAAAADETKDPDVTVSAPGGNQLMAFSINLFFALNSVANASFRFIAPNARTLQDIPTNEEFTGQLATAAILVGSMIIGPGGQAQAPLRLIHTPATLSKNILERLRKKSTQEIIESLAPGLEEALRVKPDGRVLNGNHRISVLLERGVDVNALPREIVP